jgi:hypothetical protein
MDVDNTVREYDIDDSNSLKRKTTSPYSRSSSPKSTNLPTTSTLMNAIERVKGGGRPCEHREEFIANIQLIHGAKSARKAHRRAQSIPITSIDDDIADYQFDDAGEYETDRDLTERIKGLQAKGKELMRKCGWTSFGNVRVPQHKMHKVTYIRKVLDI